MSTNVPATVNDDNAPDLFSDARLQLIRDNIAAGAPEHVFKAMIEIARVRNLDPLAKQISVIKYGNTWQITTTIDGYRAIAESTGTYAGSDEPQFGPATIKLKNGKLAPEWASVTVWKFAHGQRVPFSERVYWDEYDGDNFTWNKMPRTMLAKVAESHALRKGFPKVLSGLYTGEEMDQAGPAAGPVIDHATGEIMDAPQTRQIAPRAPQPSIQVVDPQDAIKALHVAAATFDIDHDAIHAFFAVKGYASTKDVPTEKVRDLTAWINRANPHRAKDREKVQETFREAVMAYDGPLPGAPEPAQGMEADDYAQVVAAIDADHAPVLSGTAGNDAHTR